MDDMLIRLGDRLLECSEILSNLAEKRGKMTNSYLIEIKASDGPDKGKTLRCDIYDLITAFGITNVGQMQAVKKVLRGGRADKGWEKDMQEAIHSISRALQIEEHNGTKPISTGTDGMPTGDRQP